MFQNYFLHLCTSGPLSFSKKHCYRCTLINTDFKNQCIDQDNLVQLLGPFQHDRNFTNFFATVYCYLKITATHLNINNLWRGQATRAVWNAVRVGACVPVSQVSLCFCHVIMFTKRQNQYREAVTGSDF